MSSKHNISLQQSEELFRYICGETSLKIERERYNKYENMNLTTVSTTSSLSLTPSSKDTKRVRSLSPRKSFHGALWKKPRSGSGKPSLRQVVLKITRLEYVTFSL